MAKEMDINKVIQGATRQMDLGDLAKLGHKRVRVIDEARISELIGQAVSQAIAAEDEDEAGRERRLAAEKSKRELEAKLAESQAELEKGTLASKEVDRLRLEVAKLKDHLHDTTAVIDAEKRRIAEESQREFQKLLANARAEVEAKAGAFEGTLREMVSRAEKAIPQEDVAKLPAPAAPDKGAAELLQSLSQRLTALAQLADGSQRAVAVRDQDIALAAGERHRQDAEIHRLRDEVRNLQRQLDARDQDVAVAAGDHRRSQGELKTFKEEADKRREEIHSLQRQIDAREHDVMLAALEQRRVREELVRTREEAAKVAELSGEVRRLESERELLMARIDDQHQRETAGSEQIAKLSEKLTEIKGAVVGGEGLASLKGALGEEIARQIAWAMTAQKTGAAAGIDPGLQLDALFSQKVETNIESVKEETRGGDDMTAKLAKLRSAKLGKDSGGGPA